MRLADGSGALALRLIPALLPRVGSSSRGGAAYVQVSTFGAEDPRPPSSRSGASGIPRLAPRCTYDGRRARSGRGAEKGGLRGRSRLSALLMSERSNVKNLLIPEHSVSFSILGTMT